MTGLGMGNWLGATVNIIILFVTIVAIGGGTIALVVWLVRQLIQRDDNPKKTAFDIVKERYAKGELNREEFEQIKKDLA
jgi:putative membrane protein